MYEIFPKSLKEFIEDSSIRLPRFQRKATWKPKKRFELALSIFKNYPLGASILSKESDTNKATTEWLLDGRQRRDTLKMIYEDPENLYYWGKTYLGFNKRNNRDDIFDAFYSKVKDFISDGSTNEISAVEKENGLEIATSNDEEDNDDEIINKPLNKEILDGEDLDTLFKIIDIGFKFKKNNISGLTTSFDFKAYFAGKAFNNAMLEKNEISSKKIRKLIRDYVSNNERNYTKCQTFIDYMEKSFDFNQSDASSQNKFQKFVRDSWDERQLAIIKCYERIDHIFMSRKIAIIETRDIDSTDSQKIFNLINDGGTKLTASEILSAKPKWNVTVYNPSNKLKHAISKLYERLDLNNDDEEALKTVRWDVPASCTYYFDDSEYNGFSLFFKLSEDDVAGRITLGFKLLSGLLTEGVKKEDIDKLCEKINWDYYEETLDEIKTFFNLFRNNEYLKTIESWGKCLTDVLSYGPTMNTVFLLYRNWKKLGKPNGIDNEKLRIFKKNIFIQIDKSFFEYLNNQWKGSSDSTIAKNINEFDKNNGFDEHGLFIPVKDEVWDSLLNNIFEDNTLNNKPLVKGILAPLVYYYNALKGISGEGCTNPGEIDHIMPQSLWKSSAINNKDSIQNNAFNLALLPQKYNSSKKDQTLKQLNTEELIRQIEKYEEILEQDFIKYSDISNYPSLKEERERLYKDAFGSRRQTILRNK